MPKSPVSEAVAESIRRQRADADGTHLLRALQKTTRELEGDASLGRRIRAVQELADLLGEVPEGDPGVEKLFRGRGVPSLLVALMGACGEDHAVTRNSILASMVKLSHVLTPEELLADPRLWTLLMRMCYQVRPRATFVPHRSRYHSRLPPLGRRP